MALRQTYCLCHLSGRVCGALCNPGDWLLTRVQERILEEPCKCLASLLKVNVYIKARFLCIALCNWPQSGEDHHHLACPPSLQVEVSCPKEMAWKVNMYRGYLAICHPEEQQLSFIERLVEMASSLAIREWRRLPHVVSHVHTPLLQVGTAPSQSSAWSP